MYLKDDRSFFSSLKNLQLVKIIVQSDVVSLCSLKIFTALLTKETIKHEIIFLDTDHNVAIDEESILIDNTNSFLNEKENINQIINLNEKSCMCSVNSISTLINTYKLIKNHNIMDESVLWSVIVGMSFNKMYLLDQEENIFDSSETSEDYDFQNLCSECKELISDVLIEIKKIEGNIIFENNLAYPLLRYTSLYNSLKNDIKFITKNKLIYRKRKDLEEYKINVILAKTGISIIKSRELWCNLNHNAVKYITKNLDRTKIFFKKIGHTIKYSSFDIYLLMTYFICENNSLQAFLCLKKSINIEDKVDKIFDIIISIKESIANVSKKGKLLIFNIKNQFCKNRMTYLNFSYNLISFYTYRKYPNFKYIVIMNKYEENKMLVCGYNIDFGDIELNGCTILHKNEFFVNINNFE